MTTLFKSYRFYLILIAAALIVYSITLYIADNTGAWLTSTDAIEATYLIGEINFDLATLDESQEIVVDDIILKGGTKIYLAENPEDATDYEDKNFNSVVEVVTFNITNTGNTPMNVSAALLPPQLSNGIKYMAFYTPPDGTNYRAQILEKLGVANYAYGTDITTPLNTYNQANFQSGRAPCEVEVGAVKTITVILWADYDLLTNFTNETLLTQPQTLTFKVNAIQARGDAPDPTAADWGV